MKKEINILELASDLAHRRTKLQLGIKDSVEMYYQTNEDMYYKENVQDIFNEWYDYYETIINDVTIERLHDGSVAESVEDMNREEFTDDCVELLNQIDSEWCDNWGLILDFFGEDIANKLDELIIKSQKI